MKAVGLLAAIVCAACASAMTASDQSPDGDRSTIHNGLQVDGALRLEVEDFPTRPGIMFALPSVTPGAGTITVENTRYGSLCRFDVTGKADVKDHTIGLHVSFAERLTLCTADIRALKYTATISELRGTYDVAVIHDDGAQADTLVRRTVIVP